MAIPGYVPNNVSLVAQDGTPVTLAGGGGGGDASAANQASQITQETAINTVLGVQADAPWNGAAASATLIAIQKYIGAKIEAVRALLAGTLATSTADGSHTTFGAKADAKSAATDATAISAMSVWKQISASIQAAAASLSGTLTVGTHAVTGSGNFASTVADGSNVSLGAKGDTAWDGSAASPTMIAIQKYIGAKIEAVRALLAGTLVVSPRTSTASGGIASTYKLPACAATTNATNVKGSAGRVYKIQLQNTIGVARYLRLFDKATAPVPGTDTPVKTIPIPVSTVYNLDFGDIGYYFANGIGFAITQGVADNDTLACGANDILALNIDYA